MTTHDTAMPLAAILATATLIFMPVATTQAQAGAATSLSQCKYNTRQKTLDCCNHIVKTKGMPLWMYETDSSCSRVVVCTGRGGSTGGAGSSALAGRCYIKVIWNEDGPGRGNTRQQRDGGSIRR